MSWEINIPPEQFLLFPGMWKQLISGFSLAGGNLEERKKKTGNRSLTRMGLVVLRLTGKLLV